MPVAPRHRRPRRGPDGRAAAAALVAVVVLAGCGSGPTYGFPEPISGDGEDVLGLWRGSFYAALGVGALVWGLIVWSCIRYRRRNDDLPSQTPENIPIEIAYTAIPLVIVAVLFGFTVVTQERVTALSDDPDLLVEVTGFQWSWEFAYPDEGVVVTSDGVTPPRLVVPVGATVRFDLETVDVQHNFWVPEMLVKRDIVPDVENAIEAEITRAGEWTGRCAEFCGIEHYDMIFTFAAVEASEYEAWLEERRDAGDVIGPVTEEDVNEGLDG